ncbi:MAG: hypothetical protein HQK76_07005 [Desulfobacterales bacterium]|nr:hypothetical protein [Desulfobacterales bacterium]
MSVKQNKMALKPYLEDIKQLCDALSKKELTHIILNLAKEASTTKRL